MKKTTVLIALFSLATLVLAGSMELTSARLYKKQGEWLKSLEFYDVALQKEPDEADAYFERGELLKDIAADSSKAEMAKEIAPDAADPQAELYRRMKADFQKALEVKDDKKLRNKVEQTLQQEWARFYAKAVSHDTLYDKAQAEGAADAGQHLQAALSNLAMAELLIPDRWNTYGFKAQVYTKLDSTAASAENWGRAIETILAADEEKRSSEEYQQALMVARENLLVDCYKLGRRDCVLEQADAVLASDPMNAQAIQLKANTMAQMTADSGVTEEERNRLRQEALQVLEKAREANPDDPNTLYTMGQFHLQSGDTAAALKAMNESLKANPQDVDALFFVGLLYLEGGSFVDTPKAAEAFQRITEVKPDEAAAWTNWGVALIRMGKTEEGKAKIEKAKSLSQ